MALCLQAMLGVPKGLKVFIFSMFGLRRRRTHTRSLLPVRTAKKFLPGDDSDSELLEGLAGGVRLRGPFKFRPAAVHCPPGPAGRRRLAELGQSTLSDQCISLKRYSSLREGLTEAARLVGY